MRKLEVRLQLVGDAVSVGTLAERERRIFFEYAEDFLRSATARETRWLSCAGHAPRPTAASWRARW